MHFSLAVQTIIRRIHSLKHINIKRPTKKLIVYTAPFVIPIFSDHRYLFPNTYLLIYSNVLPLCSSNNSRLGTSHINFSEYPYHKTLYQLFQTNCELLFCCCYHHRYTCTIYGWFSSYTLSVFVCIWVELDYIHFFLCFLSAVRYALALSWSPVVVVIATVHIKRFFFLWQQ